MTTTPDRDLPPTDRGPDSRATDPRATDPRATDPRADDPTVTGRRAADVPATGTRSAGTRPGYGWDDAADPGAETAVIPQRTALAEQRERFGRVRWGSAFFGWLAAVGTAVLLSAVAALVGLASGVQVAPDSIGQAVDQVGTGVQPTSPGLTAVVVLAVVIFLAYYCGGYVAGRMARFSGVKQGVAVWVWSVVATVVLGVAGLAAGNRLDSLAALNGLPRLAPGLVLTSPTGIVSVVVALVVALLGAVLGGMGGMVFHRRVDRAAARA